MIEELAKPLMKYISGAKCEMFHSHDDIFLAQQLVPIIITWLEKQENPYLKTKDWNWTDEDMYKAIERFRTKLIEELKNEIIKQ